MSTSESKPLKTFQTTRSELTTFEKQLISATIILLTLNVLDITLTLWGMSLHLIEEGNPLMQLVIEKNPQYLTALKLLLPIMLGIACWRVRDTSRKLIVYGMGLTLIVYVLIMFVHVHWIYTSRLL